MELNSYFYFEITKKAITFRRGDSNIIYFFSSVHFTLIYVCQLLVILLMIKSSFLRKSSSLDTDSSEVIRNQKLNAKRNRTGKEQTLTDKTKEGTGKMIELDYVSSDEEI